MGDQPIKLRGLFMATSYIDELLDLAAGIVELADAEGTIDKRDWRKAKALNNTLQANFTRVRKEYVDSLLDTPDGYERGYSLTLEELNITRENCDDTWIPAVNYVSDNLMPYLEKELRRSPNTRKFFKYLPWVIAGVSVFAYIATSFLALTPINHAIDTQAGIKERAAAVQKVIRYDYLMNTHVRKGGWIKGALFWPLEPTEYEIKGASEFAALAFEAKQVSVQEYGCSPIAREYGNGPSKNEVAYLSETAERLRDATLQWKKPPIVTTVDAARFVGKC